MVRSRASSPRGVKASSSSSRKKRQAGGEGRGRVTTRGRSVSGGPNRHSRTPLRRGASLPVKLLGKSLTKLFGTKPTAPTATATAAQRHGSRSTSRHGSRSTSRHGSRCSRSSSPHRGETKVDTNSKTKRDKSDRTSKGKHSNPKPRQEKGSKGGTRPTVKQRPSKQTTTATTKSRKSTKKKVSPTDLPTSTKKQREKRKPRSKSMPPLSTPFNFTSVYPPRHDTRPVSPLPSVDSSWRYQAVKLSREMKLKYKAEVLRNNQKSHRSKGTHTGAEPVRSYGIPTNQRRRSSRKPSTTNDVRYRSKSADSVVRTSKRYDHSYALIPYQDTMDYNNRYDNSQFWEQDLYNSNLYNDLPNDDASYNDDVTPESLSLHTSKYWKRGDMSWENRYREIVNSLHGSSTSLRKEDQDDKPPTKEYTTTRGRTKVNDETSNQFEMSLSINDLEEPSEKSVSSSSDPSGSTSDLNNNNTNSTSFIVPPLHSEVRANMPSFPFALKPMGPSKKRLVQNALAHAFSLRECHESEKPPSTSVFTPPLHSTIRAKKPTNKTKDSNSTSDSTTHCSATGMVSELTMPSTMKNAVFVPPLLSEVLKRKPTESKVLSDVSEENNEMNETKQESKKLPNAHVPPLLAEVLKRKYSESKALADLSEETNGINESTQDTHRKQQEVRHTKTDAALPPPPPPPRTRPSKPMNTKNRRPTHPMSAVLPDSFEDLVSSFFSQPLPPLKEDIHDSSSPTTSQDQEPKNTMVQLNDAAAQLLLMQGMGPKSPTHNNMDYPSSGTSGNSNPRPPPNHQMNHLPRSYSQPTNATPPFDHITRTVPQHTTTTAAAAPFQRSASGRVNNSSSGLLNPGNVVTRNRRVDQMPFTDEYGDSGLYTGEVNEDCRPNGQGKMKYENGVFFDGKWNNGTKEGNIAQRERMLSGFSSWKGANTKGGTSKVYGMMWIDRFGKAGQYTGDINEQSIPHGKGIMKYDFGLIAEGEWVNGMIIDGPHQLGNGGVGGGMTVIGQSVMPGGSIFPGMTSVFPQQQMMMGMNVGGMDDALYGDNPPGGQGGPPTFIRKNTAI